MSDDAQLKRPPIPKGDILFSILLTVFEIGASIAIFKIARSQGATDFSAYLWSCAAPVIGAIVMFLRTKVINGASVAILLFALLSAAVALFGSHDAKILLYKDSFVTGIIGLIFLGSLLFPRPLCYWFGQRFATGGTPEGIAWWSELWDKYPAFRRTQRVITVLWGVIFVIEATIRVIVVNVASFDTAYTVGQILPLAATALAMFLTFWIAGRSRKKGEAGQRAAQQARASRT